MISQSPMKPTPTKEDLNYTNMSKIISIVNHKGGVGKTTSVSSLGVALSRMGKRVLLVDLDAQGNLTDIFTKETGDRTLYDSLRDLQGLPIIHIKENLDLCPSSMDLVSMDIELANLQDREYRLSKLLQSLEYDYILLDCPPSLGLLTINALSTSNEVFIPLTAEALPSKGLGNLMSIIQQTQDHLNKGLSLGGIIITRYNRRKINRLVEESLRETFGTLVFQTKIRENVDIMESPLYGMDVYSYSPESIGAKDYESLAVEVINRNN